MESHSRYGNSFPKNTYKTNREWLKSVRKRWIKFRKIVNHGYPDNIRVGSAYYPDLVYDWLKDFDYINRLMKDYYKGA